MLACMTRTLELLAMSSPRPSPTATFVVKKILFPPGLKTRPKPLRAYGTETRTPRRS